jgi:hypothetical protein
MDESTNTLMFLHVHKYDEQASYRGAFLSTDGDTTPTEFRCTNIIKPTKLQRTLYGKILEEHIYVELIASPLLNSAHKQPDLVIISDELLLNFRDKISVPVISKSYVLNVIKPKATKTEPILEMTRLLNLIQIVPSVMRMSSQGSLMNLKLY